MATQTGMTGRGLEGVVATTSAISSIIGSTLTYRGFDVEALAEHSTFEEVAYLLWTGELPTAAQLEAFRRNLSEHRDLSGLMIEFLERVPRQADPMAALCTAVSALTLYQIEDGASHPGESDGPAVPLLAQLPTLIAALDRLRRSVEPLASHPESDTAENFLYMLRGRRPTELEAHIMDVALILHADHELNASTFAARVAASTRTDMRSAVVAALCTLKGPLHGGANQAVMTTLEAIGSVDRVAAYVREAAARKERFPGFGHRVYKEGDPRARVLKALSARLARERGDNRWYDISSRLEDEVRERTGLLPNLDFYSASVYAYLGIPRDLFTPVFAMGRVAGWIAHIQEQYHNNRLIRPRADYVGRPRRPYVSLSDR